MVVVSHEMGFAKTVADKVIFMDDTNGNGSTSSLMAETENYSAWLSQEPDGEVSYHLELGQATLERPG